MKQIGWGVTVFLESREGDIPRGGEIPRDTGWLEKLLNHSQLWLSSFSTHLVWFTFTHLGHSYIYIYSLKYQELYTRLNEKIATSHMQGEQKIVGFQRQRAQSRTTDQQWSGHQTALGRNGSQHTPQIWSNSRARYSKLSRKVVFGVLALDTR